MWFRNECGLFTCREHLITIYVHDLVTARAIRLHRHALGHCLYNQVESACGVPSRLQLLVHGGKVVQCFILISKQKLYDGSNIFLLVKGFGGGGNDKGNTQELLGMYPSDSFCLCMYVSSLNSLSLLHPPLSPCIPLSFSHTCRVSNCASG